MLMNTGEKPIYSSNGLLTTVAWRLNKKMTFALDGGIYITGAATQWLRDGIKIIDNAAQTEQMAYDAKSNGGVYFVPAFAGLAAPHWDSYARGTRIQHLWALHSWQLWESESSTPSRIWQATGSWRNAMSRR